MKEPQLQSDGQGGAAKNGRRPAMKVLSTSLGVALAANLLAVPAVSAEGADAAKPQPTLVEWSTDAVKAYYDPNIDWSLPEQKKDDTAAQNQADGAAAGSGAVAATAGGGGTNTIIVNGGGSSFGWDDLLLYHLLFNNGGVYSTSSWSQSHTTVYTGTHQPYQPRSYTSGTFQNKPVAGSTVRPPQTTASSGSFSTNKSTATKSTSAGTTGTAAKSTTSSSGSTVSSSGSKAPSTSSSSGSFSSASSSKSSSASSGSIGGRSSGFSSSSGS